MAAKHHKAQYWIKRGVFDDLTSFRELALHIDARDKMSDLERSPKQPV